MPTTALTVPTGAQIVALLTGSSGSVSQFGDYDDLAIDDEIAANGEASPANIEYNRMVDLLTANSFDPTALDDVTEYPYAWNALRWACGYRYTLIDRQRKLAAGGKCETDAEFLERSKSLKRFICQNLSDISVFSEEYCSVGIFISPTSVKHNDNLTFTTIV